MMKNSYGATTTLLKNPGLQGQPIAVPVLVEWKTPPYGVFGDKIKYKITLYNARTRQTDVSYALFDLLSRGGKPPGVFPGNPCGSKYANCE